MYASASMTSPIGMGMSQHALIPTVRLGVPAHEMVGAPQLPAPSQIRVTAHGSGPPQVTVSGVPHGVRAAAFVVVQFAVVLHWPTPRQRLVLRSTPGWHVAPPHSTAGQALSSAGATQRP